eukprot:Colp12_sorted_trinity150504_noHs@24978
MMQRERVNSTNEANSNNGVLAVVGSPVRRATVRYPQQNEPVLAKASDWTALDMTNMQLTNLSPSLFNYRTLTALYISNNNLSRIPEDIGNLAQLVTLDLSNNKITSIPPTIGQLTQLRELLLYNNKIATLPYELGRLFLLKNLGLTGNNLQKPFSSISLEGTQAVIRFLIDHAPVPPQRPERPWITIEAEPPAGSSPPETLTVFCYNVLSSKYATQQMYAYCPTWALEWEYRKGQILNEIVTNAADLICLQEVEGEQFEKFFLPELRRRQYDGVFKPKSRARTMGELERCRVDGCAIFYKTTRYTLVNSHLIEFSQLSTLKCEGAEDMLNRVMPKDNIAIACHLESKTSRNPVVLANVHVHWDPEYKDVKLIQTTMLLEEIQKFMNGHRLFKTPLIVCGDFNSLPNSGVYEFMSTGKVGRSHSDFDSRSYGAVIARGLSHPFQLKSAYSHIGELPYTNYTHDFVGSIDYIWITSNELSVTGLLGGVTDEYTKRCVGFPNAHCPSDHIPLLCELRIKR